MGILGQLGNLFLAAAPTVVILLLFYLFLRWSFFAPMSRVLNERHARAEGARKQAEGDRAAVIEKMRVYNEALRKARTEIFTEQDAARRKVLDQRTVEVQAARNAIRADLQTAKDRLAADAATARAQLEKSSDALAAEIARSILAGRPAGPGPRSEAR